jgi:alkylhydroperoxidase family enzyme
VALLHGSESARILDQSLRGAFESTVLPRRTKAWMFAVTARALQCHMCEAGSRRMLEAEGFEPEQIERVLDALGGDELDEIEKILLPWVRETVHYQTETIQRRTHEMAPRVDPDVLLEAVGIASLANACARLSMLEQ